MNKKVIVMNRKVDEILWYGILPDDIRSASLPYENDTFKIIPYVWSCDDEVVNDWNFIHKPSGFSIEWYKYPLRGAVSNMEITSEQFVDILYDCLNSLQEGKKIKVLHDVDPWWASDKMIKDTMEV